MVTEIQGYAHAIGGLLAKTEEQIKDLPVGVLNWSPLPEDANSPAVIVTHMCGSLGAKLYQALTGEDVGRVRDSEFRTEARSANELLSHIALARSRAKAALEYCSEETLGETIAVPGGESLSRRGAIVAQLKHLSLHLGHLELTCQLGEATARAYQP